MQEVVLEVLRQTAKSKVCLVLCDGKKMVRKELSGSLPVYEVLQNLRHPLLPELFQVEKQNGQTVILEEYIEGQSLFEAGLAHNPMLAAFCELCTVLDFLHRHKIVHRDIKPSNLRMATDGHIRLIDFDAARVIKEEQEQDTRMLGTRGYAPPEQYGYAQTDERADIYALGVTMKQLLGAQVNWHDKQIIARCTKQNPDNRYASALAVRRALRLTIPILMSGSVLLMALLALGGLALAARAPENTVFNPSSENNNQSSGVASASASEVKPNPNPYEENLLFYTDNDNHIYVTVNEMLDASGFAYLPVDMNGDGIKEDFVIDRDSQGNIFLAAYHYNKDTSRPSNTTLLWQPSSEELLYQIPMDATGFDERSFSYQITCVDIDGDEKQELLVSKGNHQNTLVTELYYQTDDSFQLVDVMWGLVNMRLADGNIFTDFNPELESSGMNQYKYYDGSLIDIKTITPEDYKAFTMADAFAKHQMIAGRKTND